MKSPLYLVLIGTTPKIVSLDTNCVEFELSIRADAGITIEFSLEDSDDFTQPNTYTNRVAPAGAAVVWVVPPNAVNANGVLHLTGTPYRQVRFTPTAGGNVTLVQQGLR